MQAVDTYIRAHKLPKDLRNRVAIAHKCLNSAVNFADDADIIMALSSHLRKDVLMFMYANIIERVPFFKNKSDNFICDIVMVLKPEIFPPGEFVTVQVNAPT